jgi:LPS export ABC transporter protein LptC
MLLLAVGLFAWVASQRAAEPSSADVSGASNDSSGYSASVVEWVETGVDGAPRYRLHAAHVEQQSVDGPLQLQQPVLNFAADAALDWQLQASSGSLSADREHVDFSGQVQGQGISPDHAPLTVRAQQLAVDMQRQQISSDTDLELDWGGMHMMAATLNIDLRSGIVIIGSGHGQQLP